MTIFRDISIGVLSFNVVSERLRILEVKEVTVKECVHQNT